MKRYAEERHIIERRVLLSKSRTRGFSAVRGKYRKAKPHTGRYCRCNQCRMDKTHAGYVRELSAREQIAEVTA